MTRMVRTLIASGILLALSSRACGAAYPQVPGIDVAWHNCIGLPGAAQNLDYACDGSRDGNPFRLVVTFTPPVDLPQFVALQVTVDVRTESARLPDWWRMGPGECREGGLLFTERRSGIGTGTTGACIDPWDPDRDSTGGGFQWTSEHRFYDPYPIVEPGRGFLILAIAQSHTAALQKGQRYLVPPILFDPFNPMDPEVATQESCPGCATPACLVVNQIELDQVAGQIPPQQDIVVLNLPIERLFVTWQGGGIGGLGCPLALPTKRATWGAIKAIYR